MNDSMSGPEIHGQESSEPPIHEQGSRQERDIPEPGGLEPEAADRHVPEAPERRADDPVAPTPLGVQRMETGNAGVDAQLERLADADHLPADGHLEVYEDAHRGLREALTALDARPASAPREPSPESTAPSYNNRS
jgi:hypothetical protein